MSLVTVAEAKLHLRVDHSEEDTLIQAYINAAEANVQHSLCRYAYADQSALAAAVLAAPAALQSAASAYEAALAAADLIADNTQAEVARNAAGEAYLHALDVAAFTQRGIVINDSIKTAILLTVGSLYENREAVTERAAYLLPMGIDHLLQPFKAYA